MKPQQQGRNRSGRFLKGVSGNPGGRPVGRVSITRELLSLAAATADWEPGEPKRKETWAQRIARILVERAGHGDMRAVALVLERIDGKLKASEEVESMADFEFAPIVLRSTVEL